MIITSTIADGCFTAELRSNLLTYRLWKEYEAVFISS
jgi:hypothetical protein